MRKTLLFLAGSLLLATAGHAAGPYQPTPKQLAALCDACERVTAVRSETRKGEAKGLGAAGGAVVGGVVGHQVGDSKMATVGGAVVGGVLGHQLERQLKKHTVWVVSTQGRDGKIQQHELSADPHLAPGDTVRPQDGGLRKQP